MREIKFRAWDKELKIFVDLEFWNIVFEGGNGLYHLENVDGVNYKNEVILLQYTGLKDKNGKEIYEGDIVEWDDGSNGKWRRRCEVCWEKAHYTLNGYWYDVSNPTEKHPVEFNFGAFMYEKDGELEVIGNIYENPELLN